MPGVSLLSLLTRIFHATPIAKAFPKNFPHRADNCSGLPRFFRFSIFWADFPLPPQYHRGGVALIECYPDMMRCTARQNIS